jgi:CRP-like cAMP-binding protein
VVTHESFLASIPLFSALADDERRDLLRLAEPFSFPAGHVIFEQGDAADGMYVLERGRVQLWARLLGEEQIALAQIGAGGVLGEFALIDRGARSVSAEVLDAAGGYFFGRRRFELLRADHRPAARKTMHELCMNLCQRLRAASADLGASPPAFYEYTQRSTRPPPQDTSARAPASGLDPARLRMLPLFGQFSVDELRTLLAPLSVWTLPRGHVLFSDGDRGGSAYATVRGAVEVIAGRRDRPGDSRGGAACPPAERERDERKARRCRARGAQRSASGNQPHAARAVGDGSHRASQEARVVALTCSRFGLRRGPAART